MNAQVLTIVRAAAGRLAHGVHPRRTTASCISSKPRPASAAPTSSTSSKPPPGVNLWREWAKIEIAGEYGTYEPPPLEEPHAGIVLSLARQEYPDMSAYTAPEIVQRSARSTTPA